MESAVILAAVAGAAAVLLALRLWIVLHSRVVVPRESLSLMVVAGSGGHTTEILRLLEYLSNAYSPRHYVIADTDEMSAQKINSFELDRADRDPSTRFPKYYIHRIPRSREVQQSWLSTVLSTLYSMWLSFPLTYRVKPDLLNSLYCICPGAHLAFSPLRLALDLAGRHRTVLDQDGGQQSPRLIF